MLLLLLIAVFGSCVAFITRSESRKRDDQRNELKMDSLKKTLNVLETDYSDAMTNYLKKFTVLSDMTALMLREYMSDDRYEGPESFDDGFVVRLSNGKLIYPEGEEGIPNLTAELVESEVSRYLMELYPDEDIDSKNIVNSRNIDGNWYLIEMTPYNEALESVFNTIGLVDTIREIESSYGWRLIIVKNPYSKSMQAETADEMIGFLIVPDELDEDAVPEDMGITKELLSEKPEFFDFNGKNYKSIFKQLSFSGTMFSLIVLIPEEKVDFYVVSGILLFAILTFINAVSIIFWIYWHQTYVRDNELLPAQVASYRPAQVRKRALSASTIGCILFLFLSIFYRSLVNLNKESVTNRIGLNTILTRLNTDADQISAAQEDAVTWSEAFTGRIADLMSENENVRTDLYLEGINDIIESNYILLFDENGSEIASSNGVVGYNMADTAELHDFLDLLKGIGPIVGAPSGDMINKGTVQLIGYPVLFPDDGRYGALIMAIDAKDTWQSADKKSIQQFLENVTPRSNLSAVVDKTTNHVVYSSDPEMTGTMFPELSWKEGEPKESDLDTYVVNNARYYGAYDSTEKYVIYYMTDAYWVHRISFLSSAFSAVSFLIINLIVSWFMLRSYTRESFKAAVRQKGISHSVDLSDMSSLEKFFEKDAEDKSYNLRNRWKELVAEQKIRLFLQIFLGAILVTVITTLSSRGTYSANNRSTVEFILFGNWKRGLNMLGFAGVMGVIFAFVVFIFFKNILLQILCAALDPKGETICRLVFSLLQYAAVLGGIYLIMGYLGMNTTFQLTSVGIISVAISLGSKDIVADIIAGIFIIFEDDFQVGDFVDINGFTGIVQEIGARSTKVLGLGDNIKIIENQSVKNVLNMSKMNSWFTLEIKIRPDVPLLELEKLLEQELPEIGKRIPKIVSGPFYKGVWDFDFYQKVLHITYECPELNYRTVRRELNHEIIVLLEKNGYDTGGEE